MFKSPTEILNANQERVLDQLNALVIAALARYDGNAVVAFIGNDIPLSLANLVFPQLQQSWNNQGWCIVRANTVRELVISDKTVKQKDLVSLSSDEIIEFMLNRCRLALANMHGNTVEVSFSPFEYEADNLLLDWVEELAKRIESEGPWSVAISDELEISYK